MKRILKRYPCATSHIRVTIAFIKVRSFNGCMQQTEQLTPVYRSLLFKIFFRIFFTIPALSIKPLLGPTVVEKIYKLYLNALLHNIRRCYAL